MAAADTPRPFITLPSGRVTKEGWITYLFSGISWSIEFYIYHLAFLAYRYPAIYYPLYNVNKNNPVLHVFKSANYGRSRWQQIDLPDAGHPFSIVVKTGLADNQSKIVISPELSALLFRADGHVKQYLDKAQMAGGATMQTVETESKNFGTLGTYLLHIVKERGKIEYAAQGVFFRLEKADVKQFLCDLTWTYDQETLILIEKPYLHLMTGQSYTAGPLTRTFASLYAALASFYQSRWTDINTARGYSPAKITIPVPVPADYQLLTNVNHVVQMIDVSRTGVLLPPWQKLPAADRADCDSLILDGEVVRLQKWFSMIKGRAADKKKKEDADVPAKKTKSKAKAKSSGAASSADAAPLVKPKSRKKSKHAAAAAAAAAPEDDGGGGDDDASLPLPPDRVVERPHGQPVLVSRPAGSPIVRDPAPPSLLSDRDDNIMYLAMVQEERTLPADTTDGKVMEAMIAHLKVISTTKSFLCVRHGVRGINEPSLAVYNEMLRLVAGRIHHTDPVAAKNWVVGWPAGLIAEGTTPWMALFETNVAPYYANRRHIHLVRAQHTDFSQVRADIDLMIELDNYFIVQAPTTNEEIAFFQQTIATEPADGVLAQALGFVSLIQQHGDAFLLTPNQSVSLKIIINHFYTWLFDNLEALGAAQNVNSLVDLFTTAHLHAVYGKVLTMLLTLSCNHDTFVFVNVPLGKYTEAQEQIVIGKGLIARELVEIPVPDAMETLPAVVVPEAIPAVVDVPAQEEQRGTKRVAPSTPETGPTPAHTIPSVRQLLQESPIYEDDPMPEKAATPIVVTLNSPQRSYATREQQAASVRAVDVQFERTGLRRNNGGEAPKRQFADRGDDFASIHFQLRKPASHASSSSAAAAAAASSSSVVFSHGPAPKIIQDPQANRPAEVFKLSRAQPLRRSSLATSGAAAASTAPVRRAVDRVKANEPNEPILGLNPQKTVENRHSAYNSWKRYESRFVYDDILRRLVDGEDVEQMMERDLRTR